MRIALAQYAMDLQMSPNLEKAMDFMAQAGRDSAQLILFPELCLSPFFPQYAGQDATRYAIELDHEYVEAFQGACREFGLAASPNVYLRERERLFDASLFIGPEGALQGVSKMVHIAQLPGFYEQDYYAPSDTGFHVFETALGRIGIVVCFDRHYPESIRTCVLQGAQIILIPTANTMEEPRDLFEAEMRVAAMQNGVFIAMCNRVGREGGATFCGDSLVVDPHGVVIAKAGESKELLIASLDLAQVELARRKRPYLALRNPEAYERGESEPRGFL